jgi:hypothetical protein
MEPNLERQAGMSWPQALGMHLSKEFLQVGIAAFAVFRLIKVMRRFVFIGKPVNPATEPITIWRC